MSEVTNEQLKGLSASFLIIDYKMEFQDGKKVSSFICVGSCDGNIKAIILQIKNKEIWY